MPDGRTTADTPRCRPAQNRQSNLPWQCLYFLPLPQGQGSLRPTFLSLRENVALAPSVLGSMGFAS